MAQTETIFAVANGYIGMRANPEEGATPTARDVPQRLPRDLAHPTARGLRLRQDRADDRQRPRRQGRCACTSTTSRCTFGRATTTTTSGRSTCRPARLTRELGLGARPAASRCASRSRGWSFAHRHVADHVRGDGPRRPAPVVISSQMVSTARTRRRYHERGGRPRPRRSAARAGSTTACSTHGSTDSRAGANHARLPMRQQPDDARRRHRPPSSTRRARMSTATVGARYRGQDLFTWTRRPGYDPPHQVLTYHTSTRRPAEELADAAPAHARPRRPTGSRRC